MSNNEIVLFFDGICGLCNGFVDFVLKHDKNELFKFSPLQSNFAKTKLSDQFVSDLKTVVLIKDGLILSKSNAVFEILSLLGGGWKVLTLFKIFPTKFNDYFYDIIASNRYNLFGKKETCRIPTPEERARFIL